MSTGGQDWEDLLAASDRFWKGIRSGDSLDGFFADALSVEGYPLKEDGSEALPALRDYFLEGSGLTNLVHTHAGAQVLDEIGVVHDRWIAERGLGTEGSPSYVSGRVTLTFRRDGDGGFRLRGWLGTRGPHDAEGADRRAEDVQAIREQILRVFEAYRQKDLSMLRRTHTAEWRGFSLRSVSVGRGIDTYMKGAQGALSAMHFEDYRILELDAVFYGDLAIVPYVARIAGKNRLGQEEAYRLRVMDVYLREPLGWNQVATNVAPHPEEIVGA